jgi:hypothetical protein
VATLLISYRLAAVEQPPGPEFHIHSLVLFEGEVNSQAEPPFSDKAVAVTVEA